MERVKSLLFIVFITIIYSNVSYVLSISTLKSPQHGLQDHWASSQSMYAFFFFRNSALCNMVFDAPYKMLLCHLSLSIQQFYVLKTVAFIALCGLYIRYVNAAVVAGFRIVTGRSQFIVLSIIKRVLYQLHGLYHVT